MLWRNENETEEMQTNKIKRNQTRRTKEDDEAEENLDLIQLRYFLLQDT